MNRSMPYIIFFAFGFIGTILVGRWGFLVGVIIGTLFLIYQELQKITSLLQNQADRKS
ncbi:hypothetical protein JCM9140_1385 [Halalkalibacter wakoensis JCM 9140]|uniref:Uncharacterized protein n=1 Tax=Halalkalibacter wakoensis JCM 9140 TaxID=1236970 RepID=W4Q0Z8_9BACI|nr:hypothetical protein [Halalkalibacter wakoensis]GAE25393.1 hypothetical protein JCM9140_1385 [Halalkalibacter wakoensis JCM 9140]